MAPELESHILVCYSPVLTVVHLWYQY